MKQSILVFLYMFFPFAAIFAQTPQAVQPGFTVERELVGAEKHSYEVNLNKGELLNFVVEQRGADVVLRVYAPDGKFYDRIDTPNGNAGDEVYKLISMTGGRYRVEVSRYFEPDPLGKYFVKTVEVRKATNAEIKAARLKDELMKIVTEDTRPGKTPEQIKRLFSDAAFLTNEQGFLNTAAERLDAVTKNPFKMPEGYVFEDELSDARVENLGDTAMLSLRQSFSFKNQSKTEGFGEVQRIGYVFKREKGEWRIISVQHTLVTSDMIRPYIKLSANQLDALVGVYDSGAGSEQFTITREGDTLFGKFPNQDKFSIVPENENVFRSGPMSFAFIRGADGTPAQLVIHYPMPDDRVVIQSKVK